jgi:hypothetical protein
MKIGNDGRIRRQGVRYDSHAMDIFKVLHHYGGPQLTNFLQVNNLGPTATTVSTHMKRGAFQTAACELALKDESFWVAMCDVFRPCCFRRKTNAVGFARWCCYLR